jgi:pyruvate/2-oxoglutarate/acetoin dehydrogenase E1 component
MARDATLVSWSRIVRTALNAADEMASEGIDVEVIDLRTVAPFDIDSILISARKTNRLALCA